MSNLPQEVVAATGADERYALPLAVTVRSAIDSLAEGSRLRLFVLDGGLAAATRERLLRSWQDPRVSVEWVEADTGAVEHLPVSDHVTTACYLRLMLPELLPADVGKLIYFDSDMLIRHDLTQLYNEPLGGELALAVQDTTAPWFDAELAASGYKRRRRYLSAVRPIPNYRELGLRPEAKYFNSGLMVLDAARWRREDVGGRVFDCLEANLEHLLWWDQYALNVVLADNWRPLDPRWNQTAGAALCPTWRHSPLTAEQFDNLRRDPWIVHYCSPEKPWAYFCSHPYRSAFFQVLDRTEWRGWRPEVPAEAATLRFKFFRKQAAHKLRTLGAVAQERLRLAG